MYFTGDLSVDPAAMTKFKRVKPTKAFGKLFYYLTIGAAGTKKEVETFTAVSVLQSLNVAMRDVGVDNIVRLARDAEDIYLDTEGRKGDLREAMEAFESHAKSGGATDFELLQLVLEHEDEHLKYLIDVRIRRQHLPGEYPISVHLNGVMKDFRVDPATGTAQQVKGALGKVFASQDAYNGFVAGHKKHFDGFVERLREAMSAAMDVDDVVHSSKRSLVRPKSKKGSVSDITHDYEDTRLGPLHAGYPGFDEYFFYSLVWSEMCFEHNIRIQDTTIVDEGGHAMLDVGSDGFDGGASDTLDPDSTFQAPAGEDISYHDGHGFESEFNDANLLGSTTSDSDTSSGGGWLDAFSSDSGGDSGGDSGSDSGGDSGGSSCGSSCGGCGGGD
ncbi:MAG: hypothetical protein JKY37_17815 [Nannocystaceae bacterium]|nr:hypothetical protein [Nannocystaceae bacterium]